MSQFHSRPGRDTLHIKPSSYGRSATHSRPLSTAGPRSCALSTSFYCSVSWPSSECEDPPPLTSDWLRRLHTSFSLRVSIKLKLFLFQINNSDKCISDSSPWFKLRVPVPSIRDIKPNRISRFSALGHPYPRAGQNK